MSRCGHYPLKQGTCKIVLDSNGKCRVHGLPKRDDVLPKFLARVISRHEDELGDSTHHIVGSLNEIEEKLVEIISDPKGWVDEFDDDFFEDYVKDMREKIHKLKPINASRTKKSYVMCLEAEPAYVVYIHEL